MVRSGSVDVFVELPWLMVRDNIEDRIVMAGRRREGIPIQPCKSWRLVERKKCTP